MVRGFTSISFVGIDSTGFKMTHASQYYVFERTGQKKIYEIIYWSRCITTNHMFNRNIDKLQQNMITWISGRWQTRIAEILPLSVVTADKGYDSEDNHFLIRDGLHALSIIPARYEHVPIWRTHGMYRKQMKRGYSKMLYNQRNKDETIMSGIKRLFGEYISSRLVKTQNREL